MKFDSYFYPIQIKLQLKHQKCIFLKNISNMSEQNKRVAGKMHGGTWRITVFRGI